MRKGMLVGMPRQGHGLRCCLLPGPCLGWGHGLRRCVLQGLPPRALPRITCKAGRLCTVAGAGAVAQGRRLRHQRMCARAGRRGWCRCSGSGSCHSVRRWRSGGLSAEACSQRALTLSLGCRHRVVQGGALRGPWQAQQPALAAAITACTQQQLPCLKSWYHHNMLPHGGRCWPAWRAREGPGRSSPVAHPAAGA